MPKPVEILKRQFTNSVGLPFRELLPQPTIVEALEAEKIELGLTDDTVIDKPYSAPSLTELIGYFWSKCVVSNDLW
jgi:hypothetical protein